MSIRFNLRAAICLVCSALVGWTSSRLGLPLAWVLGPLIVTAAFAMAGVSVVAPVAGRRFGQLIIGAAVGLNLTGPVLLSLVGWLPAMLMTACVGVLVSAVLSVGFARAAGLDQRTAYLAMMPGGLSEMANMGAATGAQPEPIALSQALRVALVVCLLPPVLIFVGDVGDAALWTTLPPLPLHWIPLVLVCGLGGALVIRFVRFQNPWMVGSLFGVALLAATGLVEGRMPVAIVNLGQFCLGIAIGARFKREIVKRLARLSLISVVFTLGLTVLLAAYAAVFASISGLDFASTMLSAAPGGFAEMVVTAQTLHLEVALVTAFHIVRSIIINGMTAHIWTMLDKLGFFGAMDSVWRRILRVPHA